MYLIALLFLCLTYTNALEKVNSNIVNKNVERSIDIASQLVKTTATITLENTGKEPVKEFLLAQEPNLIGTLAFTSVKDALKDDLLVVDAEVEYHSDKKLQVAHLKSPLEPGRTTTVFLEQVITKGLTPYPSSITQKDKQLVTYFGSHYFYSPYYTTKQKTDVVVGTRNIENYSKLKPFSQSDSTITYGPYNNVAPFTEDQLVVHYENNAPFLTVTRLERFIEISHWGNIAVEEHIEIRHTGAKLKGPFSR